MNKKASIEQDDLNAELSNSVAHARLQRKAKTGSLRTLSKQRAAANGRRKNLVAGGIHLRGNKRTLR